MVIMMGESFACSVVLADTADDEEEDGCASEPPGDGDACGETRDYQQDTAYCVG